MRSLGTDCSISVASLHSRFFFFRPASFPQGADVNSKDKDEISGLMEASIMGHVTVVKELLKVTCPAMLYSFSRCIMVVGRHRFCVFQPRNAHLCVYTAAMKYDTVYAISTPSKHFPSITMWCYDNAFHGITTGSKWFMYTSSEFHVLFTWS